MQQHVVGKRRYEAAASLPHVVLWGPGIQTLELVDRDVYECYEAWRHRSWAVLPDRRHSFAWLALDVRLSHDFGGRCAEAGVFAHACCLVLPPKVDAAAREEFRQAFWHVCADLGFSRTPVLLLCDRDCDAGALAAFLTLADIAAVRAAPVLLYDCCFSSDGFAGALQRLAALAADTLRQHGTDPSFLRAGIR